MLARGLTWRTTSAGTGRCFGRRSRSGSCWPGSSLPILAIYREYYGTQFAVRIAGLMFATMVIAGLVVNSTFSVLGLIPSGARPTRADIFSSVRVDYRLALNVLGVLIFGALFWLTARRGATDPVCGMKVDRSKAVAKEFEGVNYYFCSTHCLHAFETARHNAPGDGALSDQPHAVQPPNRTQPEGNLT